MEIHLQLKQSNNNLKNHFIQSMKLNNTTYNNTWIDYNEIQKGGPYILKWITTPNKDFGFLIHLNLFL
jgi:putative alpha-1,2-mannosidase